MVDSSRSEITNEALPGIGVPFLLFPEKSRFVSLLSEIDFFCSMFPAPKYCVLIYSSHLSPLFHCSPEISAQVPLFP